MKRKLIALFPLLFLVGCAQTKIANSSISQYELTYENGLPTIHRDNSGNITYLMLSSYGRVEVNGELIAGVDIPEKFYEHCVAYEASAGSTLPDAISALDDVVFRGWYKYTNKIYPEKVTTVSSVDTTVYAIFDGPTGGSGGIVTEGYGFKFTDGTKVSAVDAGTNPDGLPQYKVTGYTFEAGKSFSLYDFSNDATWVVSLNAWSFGDTTGSGTVWKTYLSMGSDSYTVLKTFKADVYIVLSMGNDNVYFELV